MPISIPHDYDLKTRGIDALEHQCRFSSDPTRLIHLLLGGVHPDGQCEGLSSSSSPQGSPLMMAATSGIGAMVTTLLNAGANPFIIDPYGYDALTYAAHAYQGQDIQALLEHVDYDVQRLRVACLAASVSRSPPCAAPIADKLRILLDQSAIANAATDPGTKPLVSKSL
jgi:hypothetical protein